MDWGREQRTGVPEALFCQGKSSAQLRSILDMARMEGKRLLLTRLEPAAFNALGPDQCQTLDYDPLSGTAIFGGDVPLAPSGVGIVAAGTSDLVVAREAIRTLAFAGHDGTMIADVGVAGLWRLLDRLDEIRAFRMIIAVAGMEGAMFSVLAGLVTAPVIAVPTSVGYGVAMGGKTALHAALASCAPGVVVVNIDNGFGAAVAAIKMLAMSSKPAGSPQ